jgi:phosphoribosylaminoimidazolecarboxamide formyltransferase / IMP cyclohydrolase
MAKISRALISVSDKTGIVEFAKELRAMNVSILSTGGTAKLLRDNGVNVRDVSDYTGFPEMFEGRIKTMHPLIQGGILHRRDNPDHVHLAAKHGILSIDMVVVNLYPFQQTIAKPGCTLEEAIENIDIGGPTMIRSAAKNNADVTVITSARDYAPILEEMKANNGCVSRDTNFRMMIDAFRHTAEYDALIFDHFQELYLNGQKGIEQLNKSSAVESLTCDDPTCASNREGCGL